MMHFISHVQKFCSIRLLGFGLGGVPEGVT